MTIHTFEASATLTNEKYYTIQQELRSKDPSKWKAVKNGMSYWGLSDKGILIQMHQIKKKDFYAYCHHFLNMTLALGEKKTLKER